MADLPGLLTALKVVDAEGDRARARGLSSFTFFFGLATCVITAFLVGKYTASVWIVYAAEALTILGYRLSVDWKKTKPSTMLYFLDFCWVVNFVVASLAFVILLGVLDDVLLGDMIPNTKLTERYPDLGRMVCVVTAGPLAWSVIVLNNALVLHDIELFSGCFIHLWPCLTTLSVRWNPALVMAAYPGHFDSLTGFHDVGDHGAMLGLVKLGAMAYFAWWIPFTLWMLAHGRFQSAKKTGHDTVYMNLIRTNGAARNVLGIRGNEDAMIAKAQGIPMVFKYMVLHAVASNLSLLWGALCYRHIYLHLAFCIVLVCVALYNASTRYAWMLTERYSSAIKKHIEKEFPSEVLPKKDNKENKETKKDDKAEALTKKDDKDK